jgi:hypothetical protein
MDNYRLNVFDQYGGIRNDLDENEIAKCNLVQKDALMALLTAWADTQAEDTACLEVDKAARKAETALDKARKAYEVAQPVRTFHDEWKRTVAKIPEPEPEPDPEVTKKIAAALKNVEKAEKHLAACHAAECPAKQLRKQKRAAFTEKLFIWATMDGAPKSVGNLIKERSKREAEIKMANIAKGLPHDYAVAQASTVGDSHLDRFKAGQGKGHSADQGYGRNAMRGATIKLPTQQ